MEDSNRRVVSLRRRGGDLDYDGPKQICSCGLPAPLFTSWTHSNPGRRFFRCQNHRPGGGGCGFFKWHDDEMSERAIVVINELLSILDSLQEENLILSEIHEGKELIGAVRADVEKCTRNLNILRWSLAFTWLFEFVIVFAFLCMKKMK